MGGAEATFPGRNGLIAFVRAGDIYTMKPDGTSQRRLTRTRDNAAPGWSADGQRLAFASQRTGNGDIYTMRADGTGITRVTRSAAAESNPSWSPDGQWVAFVSDLGRSRYYRSIVRQQTTSPHGGSQVLLRSESAPGCEEVEYCSWYESPAWSPDGKRIAFTHVDAIRFDSYGSIGILTLETGGVTVPSSSSNAYYEEPSWGPGGRKVLFSGHLYNEDEGTYASGLHELAADGSSVRLLVEDAGPGVFSPRFGVSIVYTVTGYFPPALAVIDGTGRRIVSTNGSQPDWQPLR